MGAKWRGVDGSLRKLIPEIPNPFDVDRMFRDLGARRGREIHLVPWQLEVGSPCGLWISTEAAEYLFFEQATTQAHQDQIKLHEMGHMLLGHGVSRPLETNVARRMLAQRLMPDVAPELIHTVLGRTRYSEPEEQKAETFASLVLTEVSRRTPEYGRAVPPEAADVVRRVESTLHPPTHRRNS
jgi:hypothetical protein